MSGDEDPGLRSNQPGLTRWDREAEARAAEAETEVETEEEWVNPHPFDEAAEAEAEKRAAEEKAKRLSNVGREDFKGTEHLAALGVKVANSVGDYRFVESMIGNEKAAKSVKKAREKAERTLKPTPAEKAYAAGIANGTYSAENIPGNMDAEKVRQMADYYQAERETRSQSLAEKKRGINLDLEEKMESLFAEREGQVYRPSKSMRLNTRTPYRNMMHIFGDKQGREIYDAIFAPVAENEAG